MDLGTIINKLSDEAYESVDSFVKDVHLVWANAIATTSPNSELWIIAQEHQGDWLRRWNENENNIHTSFNQGMGAMQVELQDRLPVAPAAVLG